MKNKSDKICKLTEKVKVLEEELNKIKSGYSLYKKDLNSTKDLDIFIKESYKLNLKDELEKRHYVRHLDKLNQESILYILEFELNHLDSKKELSSTESKINTEKIKKKIYFNKYRFELLYSKIHEKDKIKKIIPSVKRLEELDLNNLIEEQLPFQYKKILEEKIKSRYYLNQSDLFIGFILTAIIFSFLSLLYCIISLSFSWNNFFYGIATGEAIFIPLTLYINKKYREKISKDKNIEISFNKDTGKNDFHIKDNVDLKLIEY